MNSTGPQTDSFTQNGVFVYATNRSFLGIAGVGAEATLPPVWEGDSKTGWAWTTQGTHDQKRRPD